MLLKSFILTGTIQGLFLILLLKSKKRNSDSDHLLIGWLSILSCQLLFYYDSLSASPSAHPSLQLLGLSLPLISAPALYLYILSLSSIDKRFRIKDIWAHFIPYVLFNMIVFYIYLTDTKNVTVNYGLPVFSKELPDVLVYFLTAQFAIVPAYYAGRSLLVLRKYQKSIPDNYSYTEMINLNWLKWIVISLLFLFIILFLIIKYGVNSGLLTYQNLFEVVGSILSFYVFFIGYFGLRQTTVFVNKPGLETAVSKTEIQKAVNETGLERLVSTLQAEKLLNELELQKALGETDLERPVNRTGLQNASDETELERFAGKSELQKIVNETEIQNIVNDTELQSSYKNSGLNDEMSELLFQKLKVHMDKNRPFLDENLSLTMLAAQLGITTNQLSQVINQKSASNFFNFINGYRVEAVKEKLKDPVYQHYSLLAIGYDCGFRSKSSFNKIFKEMAGQTPSQYQNGL